MHTHHAVQEVVLAPGTGLLTQVPAFYGGWTGQVQGVCVVKWSQILQQIEEDSFCGS